MSYYVAARAAVTQRQLSLFLYRPTSDSRFSRHASFRRNPRPVWTMETCINRVFAQRHARTQACKQARWRENASRFSLAIILLDAVRDAKGKVVPGTGQIGRSGWHAKRYAERKAERTSQGVPVTAWKQVIRVWPGGLVPSDLSLVTGGDLLRPTSSKIGAEMEGRPCGLCERWWR